jgi:hypothetical protein
MLNRTPLLQEEKFEVPYKLPSGRTVKLRGKWDSVDLVNAQCDCDGDWGKKKHLVDCPARNKQSEGIWLQENKTKTSIERGKIDRQLRYDLQTMLYLIALDKVDWTNKFDVMNSMSTLNVFTGRPKVRGVRYNVIRRSSHKTADSMMKKVNEDLKDGRGEEWFARWNVEISNSDIHRFKTWTLNPLLENICDDFEWWDFCYGVGRRKTSDHGQYGLFDYKERGHHFPEHKLRSFVTPYMVYNPLNEGGESDVDSYLMTGSEIGLQRITHEQLFPEL